MKTASKRKRGTQFIGFEKYELDKEQLVERLVRQLYLAFPDGTLKEVSRKSQIAVSTLCNLNSGKTVFPRMDTLWKMAAATGHDLRIYRKSGGS